MDPKSPPPPETDLQPPLPEEPIGSPAEGQPPAELEQAASTPPSAPPARRRSPVRQLVEPALVLLGSLALVAGGFVTGSLLGGRLFPDRRHSTPEPEEKPKEKAPDRTPAREEDRTPVVRPDDLRGIDELIREGRFSAALALCQRYAEPANSPLRPLRYRVGLCLEGLGRSEEALANYRACVSGPSPSLVAAAQLGVARAALQAGKDEEAHAVLCSLLARSAQPVFRVQPYQAEAAALLALSLAVEQQGRTAPAATRPGTLAGVSLSWPVERYVDWGTGNAAAEKGVTPPAAGSLTLAQAGDPLQARIDASLVNTPVPGLIEQLAKAARFKMRWAAGASDAIAGRSIDFVVQGIALADALHWLTLPYGLAWDVDGSTLLVLPTRALSPRDAGPYRLRRAMRLLRGALLTAADEPLGAELYLALGNLEALEGHTTDAAGWYERLARERPRAPTLVPAYYNLGMLRFRQGERGPAREAFFQAIDRAAGHELTALCHWWIGRTHLDEKDAPAARRALLRALQGERRSPTVPAAALGLASLHLATGEPRQTWEVLREHRQAVQQTSFVDTAAFLDAYARYQLAGEDEKKTQAIAAELLSVISPSPRESWLGPILPLLRGQAMRRLGLGEEMVLLYDRTSRGLSGPLADEMRGETAEVLMALDRLREARQRLSLLARGPSEEWARRASLRLAQLDLREGDAEACLKRCRALLARPGVERAPVLGVMSQAYVALQDFARAAECLSGKVPEL